MRLWLRGEIDLISDLLSELQTALVDVAEKNVEVILPGFTHLQVAQPVSFAHHLLAYVEMFARDAERMADVRRRTNRLPLGSAALAGTTYPLDRERVARTLGMVDADGDAAGVPEQPGRRERPRLRHRIHRRRLACAWCTSAA